MVKVEEEVSKLGEAHSLYFDGAYKRKVDKAAVGVVIYDEEDKKVSGKGLMLENFHSNNEVEYCALSLGIEWCLNLGIKRLNAFGDALLLVKQVHGTWRCRNQGLVGRLCRVKELLKRFEVACLLHVPRKDNQEVDALASVCGGHFSHDITSRKVLQADALPRATFEKLYIIMGVDYMTRWAEVTTTSRITMVEVAKFIFEHICCRFGVPLEILSDIGPGFRGDLVGELMKKLQIKRRHSTPYHPQCNGLVEKVNGMICKIITNRWSQNLRSGIST
ncbi:hypothetical protein L7F22_021310 [Adiantum nelumboides]|nr:hypothetical protein [Adiantum nelumboides]